MGFGWHVHLLRAGFVSLALSQHWLFFCLVQWYFSAGPFTFPTGQHQCKKRPQDAERMNLNFEFWNAEAPKDEEQLQSNDFKRRRRKRRNKKKKKRWWISTSVQQGQQKWRYFDSGRRGPVKTRTSPLMTPLLHPQRHLYSITFNLWQPRALPNLPSKWSSSLG